MDSVSMEARSVHKYTGFTTVTDSFSRYRWVVLFRKKSDIPYLVVNKIKQLANITGKPVKVIKCDGGTEFRNTTSNNFIVQNGIKLQLSEVETPQQNGVSERTNGLISKGASALLHETSFILHRFSCSGGESSILNT